MSMAGPASLLPDVNFRSAFDLRSASRTAPTSASGRQADAQAIGMPLLLPVYDA
jgi:hypothetical protein